MTATARRSLRIGLFSWPDQSCVARRTSDHRTARVQRAGWQRDDPGRQGRRGTGRLADLNNGEGAGNYLVTIGGIETSKGTQGPVSRTVNLMGPLYLNIVSPDGGQSTGDVHVVGFDLTAPP